MGSATYNTRAEKAKALFDFLVRWQSPELPGLTKVEVKASIIGGANPIVFQMVIRLVPPGEREILQELAEHRRSVYAASEVRDGGHGRSERVFANIYDAVFAHLRIHGEHEGSDLYRGHLDSRWKLEASYYRSLPQRTVHYDDRAKVIASSYGIHVIPIDEMSVAERSLRKGDFEARYPRVNLADLTPLQQEAVVQHYVSGTKLLDFTTSIYVAAFFATTPLSENSGSTRPEMGAIYRISREEISDLSMGRVDAPELPTRFARIDRQRGAFLSIRFREAINEPGLWARWMFRHTDAGYPFTCPEYGITQQYLLAEEISDS